MRSAKSRLSANLSRRELIVGGLAALLYGQGSTLTFATASQPATPVSFKVPGDACDCHTHIFGDPQRFAFWSGRPYTPETASVNETRALHRALLRRKNCYCELRC